MGYPLAIGGTALIGFSALLRNQAESSPDGFPLALTGWAVDIAGVIAMLQGGRRIVGSEHNRLKVERKLDLIQAQLNSRTNWFLGHHKLPGLEEPTWSNVTLDEVEKALDAAEGMRSSASSRLTPPNTIPMDAQTAYGIAADNVMAQAAFGFGGRGLALP